MWENLENKATVQLFGEQIFKDVPVLLIILTSMLLGMLLMIPISWFRHYRTDKKKKNETSPDSELPQQDNKQEN